VWYVGGLEENQGEKDKNIYLLLIPFNMSLPSLAVLLFHPLGTGY
jgi:hypothetical protein